MSSTQTPDFNDYAVHGSAANVTAWLSSLPEDVTVIGPVTVTISVGKPVTFTMVRSVDALDVPSTLTATGTVATYILGGFA